MSSRIRGTLSRIKILSFDSSIFQLNLALKRWVSKFLYPRFIELLFPFKLVHGNDFQLLNFIQIFFNTLQISLKFVTSGISFQCSQIFTDHSWNISTFLMKSKVL